MSDHHEDRTTDQDRTVRQFGVAGDTTSAGVTSRRSARRSRKTEARKRGPWAVVIEVVVIVAAAFAVALLVQAFIVKPFTIHQISMRPTLEEGDRVLINRLSYHFRDPERGDVIIFHSPTTNGEDLVKRIVGVAGDSVAVKDGVLLVNGVIQEEPYLLERPFAGPDEEWEVPGGQVFVMGDNRDSSGDSRYFGAVDEDSIMGCAFAVYWPINRWRGL